MEKAEGVVKYFENMAFESRKQRRMNLHKVRREAKKELGNMNENKVTFGFVEFSELRTLNKRNSAFGLSREKLESRNQNNRYFLSYMKIEIK